MRNMSDMNDSENKFGDQQALHSEITTWIKRHATVPMTL